MSAKRRRPTEDATIRFLPGRGGDLLFRGLVRRSKRAGWGPMNRRRLYALLFFLWVAFTFLLTSVPLPDLAVPLPWIDKLEHIVFYAVSGFLAAMWRRETGVGTVRAILAGLILASVVGAVDEIHQIWIPGRFADPLDWLADAVGGGIGAAAVSVLPLLFPFLQTE